MKKKKIQKMKIILIMKRLKEKEMFMKMHFQRIDMSDAVFVINKNGYIGESVSIELNYAEKIGKEIIYYTNK